jgi:hypothetical protein
VPQSLVRNFWHFGSCGAGFWLRSLVAIFQFPFRGCRDRFDDGWFTISRSKKAREPGGHRPPGEKRLVAVAALCLAWLFFPRNTVHAVAVGTNDVPGLFAHGSIHNRRGLDPINRAGQPGAKRRIRDAAVDTAAGGGRSRLQDVGEQLPWR